MAKNLRAHKRIEMNILLCACVCARGFSAPLSDTQIHLCVRARALSLARSFVQQICPEHERKDEAYTSRQ